MRIIGFVGKKQSGKSTAAKHLIAKGYERLSFAGPLRELCIKAFNLPREYFYEERLKEHPIGDIVIDKNVIDLLLALEGLSPDALNRDLTRKLNEGAIFICNTPRQLLQKVGTEVFRQGVSDTYWINKAINSLDKSKDYVLDDVRFINEAEALKAEGAAMVRIKRAGLSSNDTHASEMEIDLIECDYCLYNDRTLSDFTQDVDMTENLVKGSIER